MNFDNIKKGIQLFNERCYFESHEELEKVWRNLKESSEGHFIQGIIKVAAALHHYKKKNFLGAERLLNSAIMLLKNSQETSINIDRDYFIKSIEVFLNKLRSSQEISDDDFPEIRTNL
jgi:predicted metal-dependent hydrolase